MGRSRGGLTTKIHALVDAEGLPIMLKLTEGQAHDGNSARDMLEALVEGQTVAEHTRLTQLFLKLELEFDPGELAVVEDFDPHMHEAVGVEA